MNECNHNNIIEQSAVKNAELSKIADILREASIFTDSVESWPSRFFKSEYFFFHFYYNIEVNGSQISLKRVNEEERSSVTDMKKCKTKFKSDTQEKSFFAHINNRKEPGLTDLGNQGDEVSFLHAMAEETIGTTTPVKDFKDHLKRCFKEYLFLTDSDRANFILGIALHGIMDSFTPSHMGFQQYANQDMGLHAQGDVIPIVGMTDSAPVKFDPGQFLEEPDYLQIIDKLIKGFGDCYYLDFGSRHPQSLDSPYMPTYPSLNSKELKMLKIFIIIGDLVFQDSNSDKALFIGRLDAERLDNFVRRNFDNKKIHEVNDELSRKYTVNNKERYCYSYGPRSYVFSAYAIQALVDVYTKLKALKDNNITSYDKYKEQATEDKIDKIVEIWQNYFTGKSSPDWKFWQDWLKSEGYDIKKDFVNNPDMNIAKIRKHHLSLHLYDK